MGRSLTTQLNPHNVASQSIAVIARGDGIDSSLIPERPETDYLPQRQFIAPWFHFPARRAGSELERFIAVAVWFVMRCILCNDRGWVCANHPDQPWDGPDACSCGGAGASCPVCNVPSDDELPRPPEGFKIDAYIDD